MKSRQIQEINAGSMADIAFLLLIFFLVTTTMSNEKGMQRTLPPYEPPTPEITPPKVKDRNICVLLINGKDQLMVEGEPMELNNLKNYLKTFIANPNYDKELPERYDKKFEHIGAYKVSEQVISLQNHRSTSYKAYLQVQDVIAASYIELRNELAMELFSQNFDELTESKSNIIKEIYPMRISEAIPSELELGNNVKP